MLSSLSRCFGGPNFSYLSFITPKEKGLLLYYRITAKLAIALLCGDNNSNLLANT